MWLLFLPVVWWAGAITACAIKPDTNLLQILQVLTEKLDQPFSISYTPYTLRCVFTFTIAYVLGIGIYYSQKKNYRRGVEHGSAKWGDAASICKRYRDKRYTQNLILTQNFRMGLDCYKHKRNLNVLVVGGSGAGKSRAYAVVNIMQCNCSMVVTDPKGELLRKTGGLLEREGYEVRVFDLINPETSFCYNPFAYVRDDKDVLKLINNLIRNTTPKGAQSSDPFWEKSETALLQALMLYLLHGKRLRIRAGGWLLTEDILPCPHRVNGNNGMHIVGHTDGNRLNLRVFQHTAVIRHRRAASILFHCILCPLRYNVTEILDPDVWIGHIRGNMRRVGYVSASDHCHRYFTHLTRSFSYDCWL